MAKWWNLHGKRVLNSFLSHKLFSSHLCVPIGTVCVLSAGSLKTSSYADVKPMDKGNTGDNVLPVYRMSDVEKHMTKQTGVWVVYEGGVYDISDFIPNHPGGQDKIMLAAGSSIEPFWRIYRQHYNSDLPMEILKDIQIGTLHPDDLKVNQAARDNSDPYRNDPVISPVLRTLNRTPINAETPTALLADNWITPTDLWFNRNHHPVPQVNPSTYRLKIEMEPYSISETPDASDISVSLDVPVSTNAPLEPKLLASFSLDDLKEMPSTTIVSTLQCAGNRRAEMSKREQTAGIGWGQGGLSTATWTGVKLSDVLDQVYQKEKKVDGARPPLQHVKHVHSYGLDDMNASIPIKKAKDPEGDVLLAYLMNGEPIPATHGYPIRMVVPGHAGVRNVKWVGKVLLSSQEAPGTWQMGMAYKGFGPSTRSLAGLQVHRLVSLQEQPVTSSVFYPQSGDHVSPGLTTIKGYAYSGGGRGIARVDVSVDNGSTWHTAELTEGAHQSSDKAWAWTFWECDVDLPVSDNSVIICKATDVSFNSQPETLNGIWNLRGINNNSWHRVGVTVKNDGPTAP